MRFLIATPLLPPESGGPATYTVGLRDELIAAGHEVKVLAFREVRHWPSLMRHVMYARRVWQLAKTADVVVVLDTMSVALPTVPVARMLRKPVIIRTGGDFVWERFVERTKREVPLSTFYTSGQPLSLKDKLLIFLQAYFILPLTTVIVFSTNWQRQIWMKPYRLKRRTTALIDNAYTPMRQDEPKPVQTQKTVVWIGREIFLKNTKRLDRVMAKICVAYPDVRYEKVAGVSPAEVIAKMRSAYLVVIPSISEVSPNIVLEAISLGTPCVVTKECGLVAQLAGKVAFVDPLSDEAIYVAIEQHLDTAFYQQVEDTIRNFSFNRSYEQVAADFVALAKTLGAHEKSSIK